MGERRALVLRGALLAVALAVPFLGRPDWVTLASQVAIYGMAAASLDLLLGYAGLASFGHAAFFGLGGYAVGILAFHGVDTPAWVAWPVAMAVAGVAALAIGALSLRTRGVSFIMITLAFAQMFYFLFVALKTYGGDDGLGFRRRNWVPGVALRDDTGFYFVCLALLVLALWLLGRVAGSRFGRVLAGIRQNPRRMAAMGLAEDRYLLVAFTLAGALAGLAGALQANLLRFVSPDMLHWTMSGEFMVMVVLGGMGTLLGPVLGAAAFVLLQAGLSQWTEHWMIVMGPVLVLVVLFARRGLLGWLR